MIISGYFLCSSTAIDLWKPIKLIVQVIAFKEAAYIIGVIVKGGTISLFSVLARVIPNNYFVILYCTVYLISPFINVMVRALSERSLRALVIGVICLFSVYPMMVDVLGELYGEGIIGLSTVGMYGSQWGYSLINFTLAYILGAYIRMGGCRVLSWGRGKICCGIAVCGLLMLIWARANDRIGYFTERSAWEYCNFLVIFEAMLAFCLFIKMKPRFSIVINKLAEASLTVYLLHIYAFPYLQIERFVNSGPVLMILHILISSAAIYCGCFFIHMIYQMITRRVFATASSRLVLHFDADNI